MIDLLVRASVDGAIIVCAIWLIQRALPHLSASAMALLWWCAAAKFVASLVWVSPVPVPLLPAVERGSRAEPMQLAATPDTTRARVQWIEGGAAASKSAEPAASVSWRRVVVIAWMAGCGIALLAGVRQWRRTRAIVRRARPAPAAVQARARAIGALIGLGRVPNLRISPEIESPVVTGLIRAVVLLPQRFADMPDDQQRMAICHELIHVRRMDVWMGCAPALAERLFFFHPLMRYAAREFSFWREAACDAAVLEVLGAGPQTYGQLLLDLGVSGRRTALSAAGAAWSFSNMKRRILMLQTPNSASPRGRAAAITVVVFAMAAIVPFKLVARPAVEESPVAGPALAVQSARAEPAFQTEQPRPPAKPKPPATPKTPARDDEEDMRFVMFYDSQRTTMSGGRGDMERARRLRASNEAMLWFIHDSREYVVRDPALLAEIDSIWYQVGSVGAEQGVIGAKQGEIGARQGEIGAKQGMIGAEQASVGQRQANVGVRQATLAMRELRANTDAERESIARERRSLDDEMRALGREMDKLNDRMREFEKPMTELGEQMESLGREMETLGRKMEEASRKAQADMRAMLRRAVETGAAQPVR